MKRARIAAAENGAFAAVLCSKREFHLRQDLNCDEECDPHARHVEVFQPLTVRTRRACRVK